MNCEDEVEMRERAREERDEIVEKYDRGREEGAQIDDWEDPKYEYYHSIDRYGFIHDKRLPDHTGRTEREQKLLAKEMNRVDKWVTMLKKEPDKYFKERAKNRDTMVGRVWKGVPLRMRGTVWAKLLGIDALKQEQPGTYERMKKQSRRHSPDIRQIDLDVNRTYRNHSMFRERYNVKQQALFHVLAAYSMYNTEVGYCQGMSQIAALLLMYLEREEDAFWGLHKLMVGNLYRMHGLFIPNFPKLIRFQEHFDKILLKKLYRLQKHLVKNEVVSSIYTLKWFFQCFLDRLPFSLTLRVWDLYILLGEQILFATAYTILKMHRQALSKYGMDEIMEFLQKTLETDFGYEDDIVIEELRRNLLELRNSKLHHPGYGPASEEPSKPFGMERFPTAEEEAGYRQPFTKQERDFSLHTIQRENEVARKLEHIDSQTSIDEGSFDHSLNETVSGEPDTEDHHSDLLEQDISIDSPHRSRSNLGSRSQTPPERHHPILPPSPLPPSKEQDELDNAYLTLLNQLDINQHPSPSPHITSPPHPFSVPPPHSPADQRPLSADPHQNKQKDDRKRHSAHVPLQYAQTPPGAEFPHFISFKPDNRINSRTHTTSHQQQQQFSQQSYQIDNNSSGQSIINQRTGKVDGSYSRSEAKARSGSRGSESSQDQDQRSHGLVDPGRVRSGSKGSKSSHGSRTSKTYYFGENPDPSNGVEDPLNTSMEGATPHKGEVVRIKVPFQDGEGTPETEDRILREDKEISPRYNGHKVTIQVNRAGQDEVDQPTPTSFKSSQISMRQVTKKSISSSSRKVNSTEEVHRSTHTMVLSEHSKDNQGVVHSVEEYECADTSIKDGKVVAQHNEYSRHSTPSTPLQFGKPANHNSSPAKIRENRNTRSSHTSASKIPQLQPRKETFF